MRTQIFTSALTAIAMTGSANALLNIDFGNVLNGIGGLLNGMLDVNLLQNGQLITANLGADLLTEDSCTNGDSTVLVTVNVPGVAGVCACVNNNLLGTILGVTRNACSTEGSCPSGGVAVCISGRCVCQCPSGTFATSTGQCVPESSCTAPNTIEGDGNGTFKCNCASGFEPDGNGGCKPLTASRAARARSRRSSHDRVAKNQHVARAPAPAQVAFKPAMERIVRKNNSKPNCPTGETACPLTSGGFECIDTTSSLTSCGGCVGARFKGVNCLAIPGALNVECHESQCQVASCFKGWNFDGEKCV